MLTFSHIQLNVLNLTRSRNFYLSVLNPFGLQLADEEEGRYVRLTNGRDMVVVLSPVQERYSPLIYHRRAVGLSHVAFAMESRGEVDRVGAHLVALGIPLLGAGKVDSSYRGGYYTIAFEDLDRIMIEVVCHDRRYFSTSPP